MKKRCLIFCFSLFTTLFLHAQNTFPFPETGSVGIGTTTPSEKLEVVGNIKVIGTSQNISIVGTGTGNYHGASLRLTASGVSSGKEHASTWFTTHRGTNGTAHVELQRRDNSNAYRGGLLFYSDGYGWDFRTASTTTSTGTTTNLTIRNSGNVGIGTTTPNEKLQVNGLIRIEQANNQDNDSPGIVLVSNDDFLYDGKYLNHYGFGFHDFAEGSSTQRPNSYVSGFFGIDFFSGGQNRLRISSVGNVGIGTTETQGFKLGVKGKIAAEEVKVATYANWADFVFDTDYNLPTLKEVEQHIKEKGHLKDIPSAKEVKKEGFFLGEMDSKLLQKIEELTLYTIEQQKEIENQNSKIEQLEKQVSEMKELKQENKVLRQVLERITTLEQQLNTKQR